MNALACIAVCNEYGIEKEDIKNALFKYTGAHRRFEFKGSFNNVSVYDDYGHHPTEITATANALNQKKNTINLGLYFNPTHMVELKHY